MTFRLAFALAFSLAFALAFLAMPAVAADSTGVPQCDALLKRYEACSSQLPPRQVHAAQKELLDGAMGIRAAAADPSKRADLERYCVDRFEQMKKDSDIKECMSKP